MLEVVETAREESGAGDEQHRQRHLRDDEPLADAAVVRGAGDCSGPLAEGAVELQLRSSERRRDAEQNGGGK